MRVLIACEFSGVVRQAFRRLGHDAWSADLLPAKDGGQHIQGDVTEIFYCNWDLMIAHPPCTHLSVSGAKHFKEKRKDGRQEEAVYFFMRFAKAPIAHIAIENPIGIMSSRYRRPDQIFQPWWFGHEETKATCLWLKNLPPLKPTQEIEGRDPSCWAHRIWEMRPSPTRAQERSQTYPLVAQAMAEQWGSL